MIWTSSLSVSCEKNLFRSEFDFEKSNIWDENSKFDLFLRKGIFEGKRWMDYERKERRRETLAKCGAMSEDTPSLHALVTPARRHSQPRNTQFPTEISGNLRNVPTRVSAPCQGRANRAVTLSRNAPPRQAPSTVRGNILNKNGEKWRCFPNINLGEFAVWGSIEEIKYIIYYRDRNSVDLFVS